MSITFKRATKKSAKLRGGLYGPSGCGKTWTSLCIAKGLGGKTALIDTEHGSASKYSDIFDFDVCEMKLFNPGELIDALQNIPGVYSTVIIDSMSAFWQGEGGILQQVDDQGRRSQSGSTFMAWGDASKTLTRINDLIMGAPYHVITTMRSKSEWVVEKNDKGKASPRKIGLAPVWKDGWEYNLDFVMRLDHDNTGVVEKTRIPELANCVFQKPDEELGKQLGRWLGQGIEEPSMLDQLTVLIKETTTTKKFLTLAVDRGHINEGIKDIKMIPNEKVGFFVNKWDEIQPLLTENK